MNPNTNSVGETANTAITYDLYRRKAHQLRSEFVAEMFTTLRRSFGRALTDRVDPG